MTDTKQPELPFEFYSLLDQLDHAAYNRGSTALRSELKQGLADQMHAHYAKGQQDERKEQIERHANNYQHLLDALAERDALRTELATLKQSLAQPAPIDMILHCPSCGKQHIDAPEGGPETQPDGTVHVECAWGNPPHRSHLCHGCGNIWRPADVPTNGVEHIKTSGANDNRRFSRNAVTAQQPAQAAVLEGWKLVPDASNMTDEQVEAIAKVAGCCGGIAYEIYRAALNAAPEREGGG